MQWDFYHRQAAVESRSGKTATLSFRPLDHHFKRKQLFTLQ